MTNQDRTKWDEKYSQGSYASTEPSPLVTEFAHFLPTRTDCPRRAIDVAGGAGRHAVWLAQQGFETTVLDISNVALSAARQRADSAGVRLQLLCIDLDEFPFPDGPWDVILKFHFLSRPLIPQMIAKLAFGGVLIVVQPTVRNLERHSSPSAQYLLAENELPTLVAGLKVLHYSEEWSPEGRHEARLVASKHH